MDSHLKMFRPDLYEQKKELIDGLQALNCAYNYSINNKGFCYSDKCMMNTDKWIKEQIKTDGCKVYLRQEVQEIIKNKP